MLLIDISEILSQLSEDGGLAKGKNCDFVTIVKIAEVNISNHRYHFFPNSNKPPCIQYLSLREVSSPSSDVSTDDDDDDQKMYFCLIRPKPSS